MLLNPQLNRLSLPPPYPFFSFCNTRWQILISPPLLLPDLSPLPSMQAIPLFSPPPTPGNKCLKSVYRFCWSPLPTSENLPRLTGPFPGSLDLSVKSGCKIVSPPIRNVLNIPGQQRLLY